MPGGRWGGKPMTADLLRSLAKPATGDWAHASCSEVYPEGAGIFIRGLEGAVLRRNKNNPRPTPTYDAFYDLARDVAANECAICGLSLGLSPRDPAAWGATGVPNGAVPAAVAGGRGRGTVFEHDHATCGFRGLAHAQCNLSLGAMEQVVQASAKGEAPMAAALAMPTVPARDVQSYAQMYFAPPGGWNCKTTPEFRTAMAAMANATRQERWDADTRDSRYNV